MSYWITGERNFPRSSKENVLKHNVSTVLLVSETIHAVSLGVTRRQNEHNHATMLVADTAEGSKEVHAHIPHKHGSTPQQ